MPATTVRLEKDVKKELDKLHGLVQMETGERLTQSELIRRLLRFAVQNEAGFMGFKDEPWRPPTRKELEAWFSKLPYLDVESDASKIDQVLYEEGTPHSATLSEAEYLERLRKDKEGRE